MTLGLLTTCYYFVPAASPLVLAAVSSEVGMHSLEKEIGLILKLFQAIPAL